MSKARTSFFVGALVMAASFLGACASILGIDQAQHDAQLDRASGGTSGSGGGANGSGGKAGPKTLCGEYCDTVMANCTGDTPVYRSRPVCDAVCLALPKGAPGDTSGNTVECRLHFAQLAGTVGETTLNCPAAGPGGDGFCGENCEGFCTIAGVACPSSPVVGAPCPGVCGKLPDPGGYPSNTETGNSVECRLYHVSAATIDPLTHCKHVAGIGACLP
jgi:hypothetical protein